ncbi:putative aldolase/synthase [Marinobacter lipolyticus SM19]|uniref:Putative aldolase/synthase n=1 Tax=Marinobacter lipolyticus SM19 TaxID=1318628 RepID=R8AWC6_9GAMM|nr:aldolase catalytic domain-containing protein [Marinobacter lipolyticus]EON90639.1 putative aldolase/synthase [Marinobacter lipolyticus SM19]
MILRFKMANSMNTQKITFLDCTLRDGGYYNDWDFDTDLIARYLEAMSAAGVDVVEMGLRTLNVHGFKGACAYTTDEFLGSLRIPESLSVGVMVNASELVGDHSLEDRLERLFPRCADDSPVSVVRIACHIHEFDEAVAGSGWLKDRGYRVGFNLMQVADRAQDEIERIAEKASQYPIDVLYFADSMGSMDPEQTARITSWLRRHWQGELGIHTHDNLRMALQNTLASVEEGVTWVDSTVTGMGRGPGNARTEELAIEIAQLRQQQISLVPLMRVLRRDFRPMQERYGWGTNPFYYLAGKYGIHPTYIQEMLGDSRYDEEDILAAIEHLRVEGGKKFSIHTLDAAKHFYGDVQSGSWNPGSLLSNTEVLLLGTGPGVGRHKWALENYIRKFKPVVIALNTQAAIPSELISLRVACHPVRLLADCHAHTMLPQPLITPWSMLPDDVKRSLDGKEVLDFGLSVEPDVFRFSETSCTLPTSLVVAYALAIAASGQASRVLMAGFDGYGADDPRNREMKELLDLYQQTPGARELVSVTPTRYELMSQSIYGMS